MKIMRPGMEHQTPSDGWKYIRTYYNCQRCCRLVVVDLLLTCDFQALEVKKGTQQKNREL